MAKILRRGNAAILHGFYKMPEQQRGRQHHRRHQQIKEASLIQAVFIKGKLILQPAEKYAEGARTGYIAADFQRFFIHKPYLDSIK